MPKPEIYEVNSKGFRPWYLQLGLMNFRFLSIFQFLNEINVSETGSVPVHRRNGVEAPNELGPLVMFNLSH
jgi:hypothetical protein